MNKQNWFYVFLIFAVIMVFCYSFYYFFMRIENKRSEEIVKKIEERSKTDVKLSEIELERYLSSVPLKSIIDDSINDAYTKKYSSVEEIDENTLLDMVYNNLKTGNNEFNKDVQNIPLDNIDYYIKKEEYENIFKNELEKMYHLTRIPDNITIHVEPYNEYYVHKIKDNENKVQKISEIVSYSANLKELMIIEKASFVYDNKVYNMTNNDSLVYTLTAEDGVFLSLDTLKNKVKNYATEYKHIFRWNERKNSYYWYSTQVNE